ncbi:MAG: hypothetical protein WBH47_14950 [Streptosporangiaceae bacterium]
MTDWNDRRRAPVIGLAFGTAVGFAGAFGGITAFIIVLALGVIGFLGGRALAGDLNLSELRNMLRRS